MTDTKKCDISFILPRSSGAGDIMARHAVRTFSEKPSPVSFEIIEVPSGELDAALENVNGEYVAFLPADGTYSPELFTQLASFRGASDITVGERRGNITRSFFAIFLRWLMGLPIRDITSPYRIYKREVYRKILPAVKKCPFDAKLSALVIAYCDGYSIKEFPVDTGSRCEREELLGAKGLKELLMIRSSATSADYDDRAFDSIIPLQRYWQRKRYEIIMGMADKEALSLDIGCGSSRIVQGLKNSVGLDISIKKLRFIRSRGHDKIVQGSIRELPFKDAAFSEIICSQVIEHVPPALFSLKEFRRVLKPGGTLILGTPDYASIWWNVFEAGYKILMPNAYGDEHITHYTRMGLMKLLSEGGFEVLEYKYLLGSELCIKAKKV